MTESIQANARASNDIMLTGAGGGAKFIPEGKEFKNAITYMELK